MPPKVAPRPRVGTVRRPIYRGRIDGSPAPTSIRATTPTSMRASTPVSTKPTGKKAMKCSNPNCPRPNIVESDQGLICDTCGAVAQEDSGLVSEQGFGETDSGRITALGVHVGESQTHQRTYAPGGALGNAGREPTVNRERSEAHARTIMNSYQTLLRIRSAEVEAGMQIFKLAWGNSFVQGRTIDSVAVVCLYLACRRKHEQIQNERRPLYSLMMIDFAERLNMDVFALGKMYHDLVRKLYGQSDGGGIQADISADLLAHGPEVLVSRFVDALEFDKVHRDKIKMDAVRIVKRMKRDWMSTGRRPSGVCGAAVLLAARMNNYRRTVREVVLTAKVTEITINKRLEEFSDTESSKLSVNQFRDNAVLDAIIASDPPSYQRAHNPPDPNMNRKRGRPRKQLVREISEAIAQAELNDDSAQPAAKRPRIDAEGFAIPAIPQRPTPIDPAILPDAEGGSTSDPQPSSRGHGRQRRAPKWKAPPPSQAELAIEKEIRQDIVRTFRENEELAPDYQYMAEEDVDDEERSRDAPQSNDEEAPALDASDASEQASSRQDVSSSREASTKSLAPRETSTAPVQRTKSGPVGPAVNTNIGNTDKVSLSPTLKADEFDDDDDVSSCLLSEAETRIKEHVWVSMNADWLRQDHAKRIKRELKEADMRSRGLDPEKEALRIAQSKGRRKDGTKKPGRRGDVSYLNDRTKGRGGEDGDATGEHDDVKGVLGDRERSAADSVRKMFEARGTYSKRVNYAVLESIYGITGDDSDSSRTESRSRSVSVQRGDREGSVASSVASAASGAEGIFRGNGGREGRRRSRASVAAERREQNRRDQQQKRSGSGSIPLQEHQEQAEREGSYESARSTSDRGPPSQSPEAEGDGASPPQQLPTPSTTQEQPQQTSSSIPKPQPSNSPSSQVPSVKPTAKASPNTHTPDLPEEEALGPISPQTGDLPPEEALGPVAGTRSQHSPSSDDEEEDDDEDISLMRPREPGEYNEDEEEFLSDDEDDDDDEDEADGDEGDDDVEAAFGGNYRSRG